MLLEPEGPARRRVGPVYLVGQAVTGQLACPQFTLVVAVIGVVTGMAAPTLVSLLRGEWKAITLALWARSGP